MNRIAAFVEAVGLVMFGYGLFLVSIPAVWLYAGAVLVVWAADQ